MKKAVLVSLTATSLYSTVAAGQVSAQEHIVKEDVKVADLAKAFATTTDEVKKLNKNIEDSLVTGAKVELPEDHIVEVKSGDTLNKIAKSHKTTLDKVKKYNPGVTELIHPGDRIAVSEKGAKVLKEQQDEALKQLEADAQAAGVPAEQVAEIARSYRSVDAPRVSTTTASSDHGDYARSARPVSFSSPSHHVGGSNLYDAGQCTYYAFQRRQQAGKGVGSLWGNANSWASSAAASGYAVNHTPAQGAILQSGQGPYGHVAYVEGVNGDGSVRVSEMNYGHGAGVVTSRTISASEAGSYNYIH